MLSQDMPYELYTSHELYYKQAFRVALAKALDVQIVRFGFAFHFFFFVLTPPYQH